MFNERSFLNPYIIAEIGVNHEGSLPLAKELIDQASNGGASCAKFQAYKANLIASKDSPYYWDIEKESTKSQYELFKKYDKFDLKEFKILSDYCKEKNIDFMVTAFDLDFASELNPIVSVHKIASADITNLPLLRKIGSFNKPVLFSCGASTIQEIKTAKEILLKNGAQSAIPLHCVLNYPTPVKNANLSFINILKNELKIEVGYSDHTVPTDDCFAQIMPCILGCKIIEKHFTHNKKLKGNDHYHAFDELDLINFRRKLLDLKILYGKESLDNTENQKMAIENARRSLFYKSDFEAEKVIEEYDIISKRPGMGISPMLIDKIIGKRIKVDVKSDTKVKFSDFY